MKSLLIFVGLLMPFQDELGQWQKYVFESEGFSLFASQEPQVFVREEGNSVIKSFSYEETFRGDRVTSYLTILENEGYTHLSESSEKEALLYEALQDLSRSTESRVVYENYLAFASSDELHFRMDMKESGYALKGRFVLSGNRLYLIAMHFKPHMTLNKRSNYFLASFTLL